MCLRGLQHHACKTENANQSMFNFQKYSSIFYFTNCKYLLQLHYDDTFNTDTSDVTNYLDGMVTHLHSHFCHPSLGTQIQVEVFSSEYIILSRGAFRGWHFQVIGDYTYHAGQTWKADSGSLSGPIKSIAAADNSGADLGVFICKDTAFYGVIGLAWVGTLCKTSWLGYNAGVNEKRQNILATSEVNKNTLSNNWLYELSRIW